MFVMYYIIWSIRAIPTYRVYQLYDKYKNKLKLMKNEIGMVVEVIISAIHPYACFLSIDNIMHL